MQKVPAMCQMCKKIKVLNEKTTDLRAALCYHCLLIFRGDCPTVPAGHMEKEVPDTTCMICLDDLPRGPGTPIYQCYTCKTDFHTGCMETWDASRIADNRPQSCPYCSRGDFTVTIQKK